MLTRPAWFSSLRTILDPAQIDVSPQRTAACSVDGQEPAAVVYPQTHEQVAAVLRWAQGEKLGVLPRGSGTQISLGNPPRRADVILSTSRLNRIHEYDAANFTVTGEAGVTVSQATSLSAASQQTLPLRFPGSAATLGGLIATNADTPKRLRYGGVRDLLLGIRVALPGGEIVHFGGKVVKNVAGYDMGKLFLGSLGIFGVVLEATFKLYALPEREETLLAAFPTLPQAATAAAHLLGTALLPSQILLLNATAAHAVATPPLAGVPPDGTVLLVGFEGLDEAVERQLVEMSQAAREHGAAMVQIVSGDPQLRLQEGLDALSHAVTTEGRSSPPAGFALAEEPADEPAPTQESALILRLGTLSSRVPAVMDAVAQRLAPLGPQALILGDYGIGLVRVCVGGPALAQGMGQGRFTEVIGEMSRLVTETGGYLLVEAAPVDLKGTLDVWGPPPVAFGLLKALKARFDPKGILNPGRFVGGL